MTSQVSKFTAGASIQMEETASSYLNCISTDSHHQPGAAADVSHLISVIPGLKSNDERVSPCFTMMKEYLLVLDHFE
jgi:hypothetical protein